MFSIFQFHIINRTIHVPMKILLITQLLFKIIIFFHYSLFGWFNHDFLSIPTYMLLIPSPNKSKFFSDTLNVSINLNEPNNSLNVSNPPYIPKFWMKRQMTLKQFNDHPILYNNSLPAKILNPIKITLSPILLNTKQHNTYLLPMNHCCWHRRQFWKIRNSKWTLKTRINIIR